MAQLGEGDEIESSVSGRCPLLRANEDYAGRMGDNEKLQSETPQHPFGHQNKGLLAGRKGRPTNCRSGLLLTILRKTLQAGF